MMKGSCSVCAAGCLIIIESRRRGLSFSWMDYCISKDWYDLNPFFSYKEKTNFSNINNLIGFFFFFFKSIFEIGNRCEILIRIKHHLRLLITNVWICGIKMMSFTLFLKFFFSSLFPLNSLCVKVLILFLLKK